MEGEAEIAADAELAYKYAKDVVRGRFPEGEASICKSAEHRSLYIQEFFDPLRRVVCACEHDVPQGHFGYMDISLLDGVLS